jgi:hypothetical protein
MATETVLQRAFSGGELAPSLAARADQVKYLTGLALCRNAIVRRNGGVENRPGTQFIAETKDSTKVSKLVSFIFDAADQNYILEFGEYYVRFFWHGAPVVVSSATAWSGATAYVKGDLVDSSGTIYVCILDHTNQVPPDATYWHPLVNGIFELPTPYPEADVLRVQAVQSIDVLTLTHPNHAPLELQRLGHTTWRTVGIVTQPNATAPSLNLLGVAGVTGTRTYRYIVTTAKEETFEESLGSGIIQIDNAGAPTVDAPHVLTWDAVPNAVEYYVHVDPFGNGVFGFIGTTTGNGFNDPGFTPDFSVTPPLARDLFAVSTEYPSVAAYYQQRLIFAHSLKERELVWASRVGSFHNFSISTPLQDDDAVTFVIAGNQLNPVAWLVEIERLIVLTDAGEWVIEGDEGGTLRPTAINAFQRGYVGSDPSVKPVTIGNSVLYVQARGTVLRDLRFDINQGGIAGRDLTLFSNHLFDGFTLTDIAYAQLPHSMVWATRSDGKLLGLTYLREHDIAGWHQHDTGAGGVFERVAVLPAVTEDEVYVIVRRTIDGASVRYIEKLARRQIDAVEDGVFMDSALSYDGVPVQLISGLDHLEGEVVSVLADGKVMFNGDPDAYDVESFRVTNGQIDLPWAAQKVHAGVPIRFAEIETLDLDVEGTNVRDKQKRVQSVAVLIEDSTPRFLAGPDADHLIAASVDRWESQAVTITGQININLTSEYSLGGRVRLRNPDPLPWSVLGVLPHLEFGG